MISSPEPDTISLPIAAAQIGPTQRVGLLAGLTWKATDGVEVPIPTLPLNQATLEEAGAVVVPTAKVEVVLKVPPTVRFWGKL